MAILLLSFFGMVGVGCSKPIIRSFTPNTDQDKSNYGMVGFGLFIYSPKERNVMNVINSSSGTFYTNLTVPYIKLEEIVSIDNQNKKLTTKPLDLSESRTKEDELSNEFLEMKFTETSNFFTLVALEPGKKYVITELAYTFRKSSSKGLLTTIIRRFPMDPYKSFQSMPIEPIPGGIRFLGTYMASVQKTDENDPYGVEDPNPSLKDLLDKDLVTLKLQKADQFIKIQRSDSLRDKYYGNLRPTPVTMEMHFLNEILPFYDNTYWQELAKSRLEELNQQ
ncbi:MAG: hypothetical protein JJT78_07110 [Leptospira sp.]|nr:hypothetical protein [Leptospira sp.]